METRKFFNLGGLTGRPCLTCVRSNHKTNQCNVSEDARVVFTKLGQLLSMSTVKQFRVKNYSNKLRVAKNNCNVKNSIYEY